MRVRYFLWLLFALSVLTTVACADGGIEITEVGLKGYFEAGGTTPVQVRVAVPPQTNSIQLQFTVTAELDIAGNPSKVDHFSQEVSVKPGETAQIDSPLHFDGLRAKVDVSAIDSGAKLIGRSEVKLESFTPITNGFLVVMLCRDRIICDAIQSQISFSGSGDDTSAKNQRLKFVALDHPRENWWDYSAAKLLIVADPVSSWSADERMAVELALRTGSRVILLEKELDDPTFLAPYRKTQTAGKALLVGQGSLWTFSEVKNNDFAALFASASLKDLLGGNGQTFYLQGLANWLRGRVGVAFSFPRFRWILLSMAVYILVVGLANFALLRRLGKLEWGWITTAVIALVFAGGFYMVSAAKRPTQTILDCIPVYWMDSRSPLASETLSLRISSPRQQSLLLSIDEPLLISGARPQREVPNAQIASSLTQANRRLTGRDLSLGPPFREEVSLLRWSFVDLDFQTVHSFPGSVRFSSGWHLKNETGQQFREAVYLDIPNNKQYEIPGLAPNQEVDISAITPSPIRLVRPQQDSTKLIISFEPPREKRDFALRDLLPDVQFLGPSRPVFVGVSAAPLPTTHLSGANYSQHNLVLTVVSMDQP